MKFVVLRAALCVAMGWSLVQCSGESVRTCSVTRVCEAWTTQSLLTRRWSFDQGCIGARCDVVALSGSPVLGESFHPSERALHLPAGSAVALPVQSDGVPDGANIAFSARCSGGATLYFDGDEPGVSVEPLRVMDDGPWRRVVWTLRTPLRQYQPDEDYRIGTTQFAPRFRVTGAGYCVVDQVIYDVNIQGCSASRDIESNCSEMVRTEWLGGTTPRFDAGNWEDRGPRRVDTGPTDTGPTDTGVRDVLDATTATDATATDADDARDATDAADAEDASDAATD